MATPSEWFCALLDSAAEVYFRYGLEPSRRGFAYISPSIHGLTGHTPAEFHNDPALIKRLIAPADRRFMRRMLRARRSVNVRLHLVRGDVLVPVEVRAVSLVRRRRLLAVEGVARLGTGDGPSTVAAREPGPEEPVQRRLASLMVEVHGLLHRALEQDASRVLPGAAGATLAARPARMLRCGVPGSVEGWVELDADRLSAADSGRPVALTAREVLLLRYLLERRGRVVTRQQLLTDVWSYRYTGDDRTVDVHVSRLRRKLPSLGRRLVAVRHIGYRLADEDAEGTRRVANS